MSYLADYTKYIKNFSHVKALVVGDLILDRYIWGEVNRISPEAPVPVVKIQERTHMPGGSANVVYNICGLGGRVYPCGIVGKDRHGKELIRQLRQKQIDVHGIFMDSSRPTTIKTRIMAKRHQMLRVDEEETHPISRDVFQKMIQYIESIISDVDIVIFEDYGKGVITRELIVGVLPIAQSAGKMVAVDPKEKHFDLYKGITLITPNVYELRQATGKPIDTEEDLQKAAKSLLRKVQAQMILVTQGSKGMTLFHKSKRPFHVPTMAREVFDVSGAGDTVIAVFCMALIAGADLKDAAHLANCAAGIVVEKLGVAITNQKELIQRLREETACV